VSPLQGRSWQGRDSCYDPASMGKLRACALCGATIGQNIAAHPCPHGEPCHYALDGEGLPIDWRTPSCIECQDRSGRPAPDARFALTEQALEVLSSD